MNTIDEYYTAQQMAFDASVLRNLIKPATLTPIDLSRIPPKPWPWPRSMTDIEIAEYEAMLGGEYRITRGVVTARGDQVYGEPITSAACVPSP